MCWIVRQALVQREKREFLRAPESWEIIQSFANKGGKTTAAGPSAQAYWGNVNLTTFLCTQTSN